jgi:hypothetical protein
MNENDTWIDPAITVEASENQNSVLAKVAAAFETVKTNTKTIVLALTVTLVQPAMPGDANAALRYSQPSMSQNEEGEVNKSSIHQTEPITRDTLKSFMDPRLHTLIGDMSDNVLGYLSPMMTAIMGIENERHRWVIARWMIGVFLAPNVGHFDRAVSRFDKVGLSIDPEITAIARMYLQNEQFAIDLKNGKIILALASQDEIIARQEEDLSRINSLIEIKEAALAINQAELASDQAELASDQAALASNQAELLQLIELRDEILQNIEDIRARGTQRPA